ncbi:MAG: DUF2510 domain-containing protein, partial [Propionibacteriaceae bacterium]|nr:DUF2510 domain-containing protein [Propionibacteriaceae bacterium]
MAQQGWYPDPSGQAGMFRYWDGSTWSQAVSPTPLPGPPAPPPDFGQSAVASGANGFDPTKPLTPGQSSTLYQPTTGAYPEYQSLQAAKAKKPAALWVTIIAGVLVLALIVWFVVTRVVGNMVETEPTDDPAATATTRTCPDQPVSNERAAHPDDGWVYGGQLAYPQMGDPWSAVQTNEVRVPFGRDVADQEIMVHQNPTGQGGWTGWV